MLVGCDDRQGIPHQKNISIWSEPAGSEGGPAVSIQAATGGVLFAGPEFSSMVHTLSPPLSLFCGSPFFLFGVRRAGRMVLWQWRRVEDSSERGVEDLQGDRRASAASTIPPNVRTSHGLTDRVPAHKVKYATADAY